MRGWQAPYAHVWAASNMRAMPENEIPPALPGDHYFSTVNYQLAPALPPLPVLLLPQRALLLSLLLPLWRRMKSESASGDTILNSAERSGAYFVDRFLGMKQEELHQACLDAKGKLLVCSRVAEGCVDSVSVNVRRIVENALRFGASNVILAHNHPSGVALPSGEDERMTLAVWDALHTVGIELVDHIIVADGDFVSLRQNGLLPPH